MEERIEIVICLGSSCFSRGNRVIVQIVREYIQRNAIEDRVVFRGNRCFSSCDKGPIVQIGQRVYECVDQINIIDILDENFKNL